MPPIATTVRLAWLFAFWACGALSATLAAPAHAQHPFTSPVRILVPVAAGGTSDIAARSLAASLSQAIGQPVVVENRPGATGRIAAEALKHAVPDGSTLMIAPTAVTVLAPLLHPAPGYDPTTDFAPVSQVGKFEYGLAVGPDHPARTVPEFVAWAKAHPRKSSYGTAGAGSIPHLIGMMLGQVGGGEFLHVPYRDIGQVRNDVIGGQIAAAIGALSDLTELHRSGNIRIIATSGAQRSSHLPSVPTFREQGLAPITVEGWTAVYAPAGTPPTAIEQLSKVIAKALGTSAIRERLAALGIEATGTTPGELAAIMAADRARWAPLLKASGLGAAAQTR